MPPEPTKPRHYQAGRTNLRVSVTISPEARAAIDLIREHTGVITISEAMARAVLDKAESIATGIRDAKKHHPDNRGKNS